MLQPKKQKFRKQFRGTMGGMASRGTTVALGDFGLKSMSGGWVSAAQIEAARRTITHATRRKGKIWVRIFPDKPVTQKSAGVRMGGGKGDVAWFVSVVRPGRVLFEVAGVEPETAHKALKLAAAKLPVETRIVKRV
ncbi:50S ribosomal protein L16 [Candidatus Microgenomates bacterium]|nr:50S ribosomal protein L16 [Candidatus Microgenomates bacterium]